MAAYRRVYDSRHLQADCQEAGGISCGTLRSAISYELPFYVSYRIVSYHLVDEAVAAAAAAAEAAAADCSAV